MFEKKFCNKETKTDLLFGHLWHLNNLNLVPWWQGKTEDDGQFYNLRLRKIYLKLKLPNTNSIHY